MNNEVSLVKIIAMFMIVGCHLSQWFGMNMLAMMLNVGVPIFLFLSGYLYANKNIGTAKSFVKKKFLKICIPTYTAFLIVCIINILVYQKSFLNLTYVYLLNLQGIGFLFNGLQLPYIDALGHLWFMSIIFINYLILIIIKKYESTIKFKSNKYIGYSIGFFLLVSILGGFIGISFCYIFTFFYRVYIWKSGI